MPRREPRLTLLGRRVSRPVARLEAFPNRHPGRDYQVVLETTEFTSVCPVTGQPDFGSITITYVPDRSIVESKSLKLYLWSYRGRGIFHEEAVNRILDDVVRTVRPRRCQVKGVFNARGGIAITVAAEHPAAAPRGCSCPDPAVRRPHR